jgi:hypothetical protein
VTTPGPRDHPRGGTKHPRRAPGRALGWVCEGPRGALKKGINTKKGKEIKEKEEINKEFSLDRAEEGLRRVQEDPDEDQEGARRPKKKCERKKEKRKKSPNTL